MSRDLLFSKRKKPCVQEDVLRFGIECCIERSPTATRRTLGMIAVSVLLLPVLTSPAGRPRRHKKTSGYSADNTETSIEQHVFAVVDELLPLQTMCFSLRFQRQAEQSEVLTMALVKRRQALWLCTYKCQK